MDEVRRGKRKPSTSDVSREMWILFAAGVFFVASLAVLIASAMLRYF